MKTRPPRPETVSTPLPLTREALDGSLRRAAEALIDGTSAGGAADAEALRPAPIRPDELVRRLRPFIGLN